MITIASSPTSPSAIGRDARPGPLRPRRRDSTKPPATSGSGSTGCTTPPVRTSRRLSSEHRARAGPKARPADLSAEAHRAKAEARRANGAAVCGIGSGTARCRSGCAWTRCCSAASRPRRSSTGVATAALVLLLRFGRHARLERARAARSAAARKRPARARHGAVSRRHLPCARSPAGRVTGGRRASFVRSRHRPLVDRAPLRAERSRATRRPPARIVD